MEDVEEALDVGLELIEHMHRQMQIDEEWTARTPRGFTWWPGQLAQRIWVDEPFEDFGIELFCVHAETDFLSKRQWTEGDLKALGYHTAFATMSGMVLVEGGVRLAAKAYFHGETLRMWKHVFTIAALLQVTTAYLDASTIGMLVEAGPTTSNHPETGPRETLDDMLDVIRDAFAPAGAAPSTFIGEDFLAAREFIDGRASVLTNADIEGLTGEFPFNDETALLQMRTNIANPRLGNGLLSTLTLPTQFPPAGLGRLSLEWNTRDYSDFNRNPFLGSWCPDPAIPNSLTFASFMPNFAYLPGIASTFALYSASKAKWALETMSRGDHEESKKTARSGLSRFLGR